MLYSDFKTLQESYNSIYTPVEEETYWQDEKGNLLWGTENELYYVFEDTNTGEEFILIGEKYVPLPVKKIEAQAGRKEKRAETHEKKAEGLGDEFKERRMNKADRTASQAVHMRDVVSKHSGEKDERKPSETGKFGGKIGKTDQDILTAKGHFRNARMKASVKGKEDKKGYAEPTQVDTSNEPASSETVKRRAKLINKKEDKR
jgi:hypothetical protein